jgi:hypothetical protein
MSLGEFFKKKEESQEEEKIPETPGLVLVPNPTVDGVELTWEKVKEEVKNDPFIVPTSTIINQYSPSVSGSGWSGWSGLTGVTVGSGWSGWSGHSSQSGYISFSGWSGVTGGSGVWKRGDYRCKICGEYYDTEQERDFCENKAPQKMFKWEIGDTLFVGGGIDIITGEEIRAHTIFFLSENLIGGRGGIITPEDYTKLYELAKERREVVW